VYAVKLNHCLSADHLVLQVGAGEQPGTARGLNAKQERCVWFATAFAADDRCMRRVMSTKLKLWHDGLCTFVLPREK